MRAAKIQSLSIYQKVTSTLLCIDIIAVMRYCVQVTLCLTLNPAILMHGVPLGSEWEGLLKSLFMSVIQDLKSWQKPQSACGDIFWKLV